MYKRILAVLDGGRSACLALEDVLKLAPAAGIRGSRPRTG